MIFLLLGNHLGPSLFALVMDKLTRHIKGEVSWCMLVADDIILIHETHGKSNERLEVWRRILKSKGFRLSRTKTKYLECRFSDLTCVTDVEVRIDTQVIPLREEVSSILVNDLRKWDIDKDVTHRIEKGG